MTILRITPHSKHFCVFISLPGNTRGYVLSNHHFYFFNFSYSLSHSTSPQVPLVTADVPCGWESVDYITAVAGLMKFPHSGFMWVQPVLQHGPAVFISRVNDCPACSDTVMLSDRLIYLPVSAPQVYPRPPSSLSLKAFRSCLIFLFFFSISI